MYEVRWHMSFWDDQRIGLKPFDKLWDAYEYAIDMEDMDTLSSLFIVNGDVYTPISLRLLSKRTDKMWKQEEYLSKNVSI